MININRKLTDSDGYSPFAISINAVLAGIRESGSYINQAKAANDDGLVYCPELTEVVREFTNLQKLKVYIDFKTKLNAYTTVPLITTQTVMLEDWIREYAQTFIEAQIKKDMGKRNELVGWIDKDNKAQGYYKEVPIDVALGFDFVYKNDSSNMSVTNAGAVLFHELGHDISLFKSITQTARTNAILYDTHQELMNLNDSEDRVRFISKLAARNDLDINSEDLKNAKNAEIYTVVIGATVEKYYSEYGCNVYEYRNFEAMADNFAVRHGYPVDLVLSLDKMHTPVTGVLSPAQRASKVIYALMEFIAELVGTGLFWLSFLWLVCNPTKRIYDEPKARFTRIRNEMLSSLRDRSVSPARRAKVVKDIEVVNRVISQYTTNRTLLEVTYEFLTPTGRKGKNLRRLHQVYEELANNSLYSSTAKLESLLN